MGGAGGGGPWGLLAGGRKDRSPQVWAFSTLPGVGEGRRVWKGAAAQVSLRAQG